MLSWLVTRSNGVVLGVPPDSIARIIEPRPGTPIRKRRLIISRTHAVRPGQAKQSDGHSKDANGEHQRAARAEAEDVL